MTETNLSLIRNRTGNAEGLQTYAESFRSFRSMLATFLDCYSRANGVRPDCVFKADRLNASYYSVNVNAFVKSNLFAFFNIFNAVFGETLIDLIDSSFVSFKSNSHN